MIIAPLVLDLADESATVRLGAALAKGLRAGDVVALTGTLGAGKSALCRAMVRAATGNPDEEVPSPTFTLVQIYDGANYDGTGGAEWWHFDLYRLKAPDDALELGIEDAFATAVCLIEWPERLGGLLPKRAIVIDLAITGDTGRRVTMTGPARLLEPLGEFA